MLRHPITLARIALLLGAGLTLSACGPSGTHMGQTLPIGEAPVMTQAQRQDFLTRINALRGQPRRCGERQMPAAGSLQLNDKLSAAAQAHSQDMHDARFFDHDGSDGSNFAQRVQRQGYTYSALAENLGYNQRSSQDMLDAWLASPGHCANLMSAQYSEVGVGYVNWRWTGVFASPR